jgi:hypothetical protein
MVSTRNTAMPTARPRMFSAENSRCFTTERYRVRR